jgi:hypothetical protein
LRNSLSCFLFALLTVPGCGPRRPDGAASQSTADSPAALPAATAIRVRQGGGAWQVYRLPDLAPVRSIGGRLPRIDRLVGLDPESDQLFALTLRDELLAVDLLGGRIDTVATQVVAAVLGPDGTLYGVNRAHRVTTLKRRVRRVWPDTLPGTPRELFGAADQRLLAVARGDQPQLITASADQPPAAHPMPLASDVAATLWGDVVAVAVDSGIILLDPAGRRSPEFVPIRDHPRAVAFSPAGHRLYVARRTAEGLVVVDRYTHRELDRVTLPAPAAILRPDPLGRWLLAGPPSADSAWLVDLPSRTLRGVAPTPWSPDLPTVAPDGTLLTRQGEDLVAIDPEVLAERARVPGGAADLWLVSSWHPRGMPIPTTGEQPAAAAAGGEGPVYVQVSVSQNRDWSTENAQQLARAGLPAQVLAPRTPEEGYRVVLGPYPTRAEAEAIGRKLGRPFWIFQADGRR